MKEERGMTIKLGPGGGRNSVPGKGLSGVASGCHPSQECPK